MAVQSGYMAVKSGYIAVQSAYLAVQSGYIAVQFGYIEVQSESKSSTSFDQIFKYKNLRLFKSIEFFKNLFDYPFDQILKSNLKDRLPLIRFLT